MIHFAAKRMLIAPSRRLRAGRMVLACAFGLIVALVLAIASFVQSNWRREPAIWKAQPRAFVQHHTSAASQPYWRDQRRMRLAGPYQAQVLEVMDGDTFAARIQVWLGQDVVTLVRLRGVDAPEIRGRCRRENDAAVEAKRVLAEFLSAGAVSLRDIGTGKYAGRVIAKAFVTGREGKLAGEAGAMLMAGGYARAYRGGRRNSWCNSGHW